MVEHLLHGVHQFRTQVFNREREFYEQLSLGQNPSALFVSCSDSRVDPNLILQAAPGDLFALRNAGNLVPPYGASSGGEPAGIEYAVSVLNVEHIVVCGHTQCGAMKALLDPSSTKNLPAINSWLGHAETTRQIMTENYSHLSGKELLNATIQENVLVQIENLQTHPSVAARLQRGQLNLHAWVYQLEDGGILAFNSETEMFEPLVAGSSKIASKKKRSPGSVRNKTRPAK